MYAVTSMWFVSRTRATLRSAEFGFLGVLVKTRVQTPRRWGAPFSAPVLTLAVLDSRPLRTSCWIVGTLVLRIDLAGFGPTRPQGAPRPTDQVTGRPGGSPTG